MTDDELFRPCSASSSRKVRLLAPRSRACEHSCVSFHRLCLCLLAFSLAACSSYDSRWRHPHFAAGGKDRFEGSYVGTWKSTSHPGAGGRLWCIVTKKSRDEYLAEFKATWHGVFSSEHAVVLKITEKGDMPRWFPMFSWPSDFKYRQSKNFPIDAKIMDNHFVRAGTKPLWKFTGETEIKMWIGSGTYRCTGKMNGWAMEASYDATYDRGTFAIGRPFSLLTSDPPLPAALTDIPTDSSQTRRLTPRPHPR